jgi:DNA-binding transcriptional LysR family regulator
MDFENLWPQLKDFFQKTKNITLRTDSSNALLNLVKNGLGISFIPTCVAAKEECLMAVLEKEIHIEHPFWIICPSHLKKVKKIRALADYLKQTTEKL